MIKKGMLCAFGIFLLLSLASAAVYRDRSDRYNGYWYEDRHAYYIDDDRYYSDRYDRYDTHAYRYVRYDYPYVIHHQISCDAYTCDSGYYPSVEYYETRPKYYYTQYGYDSYYNQYIDYRWNTGYYR